MAMTPLWLHVLSILSLLLAVLTALVIAAHELRHPQHMWIMNLVWPVVALFGSLVALWAYFRYGVLATRDATMAAKRRHQKPPNKTDKPFAVMVGEGAAMIAGFLTSYPVNWWLIRAGIKERM
jgi:hypothetical protein